MLRYLLFYSFFPAVLLAGVPEIRNVTVKQRFPWNNKIEISYNVIGNVVAGLPEWQKPFLSVSALDRMTGSNYVSQASAISGDTGTEEGAHRIVWDLNAQGVQIKSDDVVFTVAYLFYPKYCIVDLSAGVNAVSYPFSYLSDVPAGGWTDEHKTTKLVLRLIESGSFKMNGSYDVTLTEPYYCGVFEVTQKQYELVMGNKPSCFTGDKLPVEQVSWNAIRGNSDTYNWPTITTVDSNSFVGRLQARTGLNFDLPTEAQWEYACRAGTTTAYSYGDSANGDYMWYRSNSSYETHEVGTKLPNAWGLYDMHGNVWEWCLDWFGEQPSYTTDFKSPETGTKRIFRGGGCINSDTWVRSIVRSCLEPYGTYNDLGEGDHLGVRLAITLLGEATESTIIFSDSNVPIKINSQINPMVDSIEIPYDSSWVGGDANAIVVVRDNGTEIKRTTGVGEFTWSPTTPGKHMLTYTTYIDGVQQDEVYTATVFKDWKYTVEDGKATIVATTQTSGNVTIPSEIDGYPVAAVNENTFRGCAGLKSVTLPLAIFEGNVAQVEKNNWTEGEDGVYQSNDINDSESTSMTLEVEGSCDFTFDWKVSSESDYDKLKWYLDGLQISEISGSGSGWQTVSYSIPEGSHTIRWEYSKDGSVSDGDDCGWVRFTESVSASMTMSNLFPDSYTAITNVFLTGEGEKIPAYAFAGCSSLQNVEIPESATQIGIGAFTGCAALSDEDGFLIIRDVLYGYFGENGKVTIPNGVTDIAPEAFCGCDMLTEVIIPDSVTSIGYCAFAYCHGFKYIEMPATLKNQVEAERVFSGCPDNLEIVYRSAEILNVTVKQLLPLLNGTLWNGTVNISFEVDGSAIVGLSTVVSALDRTTGSNYVAHTSALSGDTETAEGVHRIVWDLNAQGVQIKSDDVVFTVAYVDNNGDVVYSNLSEPVKINAQNGQMVDSIEISYDSSWVGGDTNATVVVRDNGTEIKRTTGVGEFTWSPTTPGKHILTYATYIDGIQQEEVYTATVFKDWKYTVEGGNATIVATTQKSGSVTIPSEIDGFSVVGIGSGTFRDCVGLTSVVVPNSVTRIEEGAFKGCESITNMVLPFVGASRGYVHDTEEEAEEALFGHIFGSAESGTSSVRQEIHVGHWSGSYSYTRPAYTAVPDSLKSVTITDETAIGYGAFSGCSHLESVVIAGRGVWLEEAAFSGCSNLRNLELPNGTSYSWGVFLGCGALRRVAIPQAFCTDEFSEIFPIAWNKITDLVIQDGTTRIDEWAFEGCAFRNVILPSTLERIDEGAFGSCSSITNIVIPASVKEIGHYAFEACVGLPAFVVDEENEYYKSVNGVLFSKDGKTLLYCPAGSGFATYEIPSEVEEVWDGAFAYCSNLSAITVASGNGHFKSNGGVLFSADGTRLVQYPAGKIGPYSIPEGTIELAEFAFGGCGGLSEITFLKSLTEIACAAFMDCTELRSVNIPDWVTWIGDSAFEWCTSLEYVKIPEGVEYIGYDERAFNNCGSIKKVVIPQFVLSRGLSDVFPHSYGNIQEIVIIGDVDSAWDSFWGCNALTKVVIDESVGSIADWSEYVPLVVFEGRAPDGLAESGLLDCAERIQYKREYADGFDSIVDDEKFMGFPVDYNPDVAYTDLSFFTGRGAEWTKDTVEKFDEKPSLKSGNPGDGGVSWVEAEIVGKGKGSFVWKVSSEYYGVDIYDYARFIVDGVTAVETFGGVQDWTEVTFEFADIGPHTLRWEYVKDSEDDPELDPVEDCVWVNGFSWVPKYNVSFDVGDVGCDVPAEIPAHVDEVVILPDEISDPDGQYVFDGWSDGKNTYSARSEYVVPNGDIVLKAIWLRKINVSFDLSGAIGDVPVQIRELGGRVVKLPVTDGITKEDHVFAGWSDGVNIYEAGADYIVPEDDVVLIALWNKKTFISFVTPDDDVLGDLPEMAKILPGGKLLLPASDGISRSCYTFVGWSDGETVYEVGTEYVVHEADVTFSPVWRANTLLAPVISSADVLDGGVHDKESATVDIRAESGATIYYTLDGTEPSTNSICYEKSFVVDTLRGNVKAIAVKENYFNSDIAEFSFTRLPWSLGECVNSEMLNVTTGGDVGWHRVLEDESHDGTAGLRSGEISHGGSSWVEVEVRGRGTISFWWKTSSERTVKGKRHDGCVVSIDGSEIAYMDHTTNEWTYVEYYIESKGPHVVRWTYQKDDNGLTNGADCAWLDAVGWSAIIPITRSIVYENLMGAENSNPDRYEEGDAVTFLPPSDVDNYTFTGWMPSAITESDTGDKVVTANWEWTPQDAIVDASITGWKPVTVKADWVKTELEQKFGAGKKESFITRFGDNLTSAMTKKTGKRDVAGNELLVWHDYVAGTDPTDINSTFKAKIEMQNGKPVISWEPNLNSLGEERVYMVYGKESLSDIWHSPIAALDHFFKVNVLMPYDVTVILNTVEGSSVGPLMVRVGQSLGVLPTPTRVGYIFLGWFTAQEGGVAVTPETIVTADMTIYARWAIKSYTVVFDANGGSGGVSKSYNHGSTLDEMPVPTRDGYTFTGWFTAQEGGEAVTPDTIVTADMTIHARWELDIHEKVQLWEGGPYWATTNIGAENPEDYGYYFWWGDTVGYKREGNKWVASDGWNSNSSFRGSDAPTYGKDNSTLQGEGWITADGVLSPEHDAARAHWGGDWRMPTYEELDDLCYKCDWIWTTMNGVDGYIVRGKGDYSSKSIFLPGAGYGYGTSLRNAGSGGYYWSSAWNPDSDYDYGAWSLAFFSGGHSTGSGSYRYYGQSIRPLQGFTK